MYNVTQNSKVFKRDQPDDKPDKELAISLTAVATGSGSWFLKISEVTLNGKPPGSKKLAKIEGALGALQSREQKAESRIFPRSQGPLEVVSLELASLLFDLRLRGTETIGGRPAYVLVAEEPKSIWPPINLSREDRDLINTFALGKDLAKREVPFRETFWIDTEDFIPAQTQLEAIAKTRITLQPAFGAPVLWKGGRARYCRSRTPEGIWVLTGAFVSRAGASMKGNIRIDMDERFTDHKRFVSEPVLSFPPDEKGLFPPGAK
jgi:hypothetical protein